MKLILDLGSGNTCKNDIAIVRKMIDSIHDIDTEKHEIILKWQLFESAPPNIPLKREIFEYAYNYAKDFGYKTTASVFDKSSLLYLCNYNIPFVKIACRNDLYYLADGLEVPVIISVDNYKKIEDDHICLCCVSQYPAKIEDYEFNFERGQLSYALSDHTIGLKLYRKYKPKILEKHFVLKREIDNPDSGDFALLPEQLGGLLND